MSYRVKWMTVYLTSIAFVRGASIDKFNVNKMCFEFGVRLHRFCFQSLYNIHIQPVLFIKAVSVTRALKHTKCVRERTRKRNIRHHQKTPRAIDFRYSQSVWLKTQRKRRETAAKYQPGRVSERSNDWMLNNAHSNTVHIVIIHQFIESLQIKTKDPWAHLPFTHISCFVTFHRVSTKKRK